MARVFESMNGGFRNDVNVHGVVVYGLCMFRSGCYGQSYDSFSFAQDLSMSVLIQIMFSIELGP